MSVLSRLKMGPYDAVIEYDPGGPVGGEIFVMVTGPKDFLIRRYYFFESYSKIGVKKFLDKIALDEGYRKSCLGGTAKWQVIQRIYLDMIRNIEGDFYGLLGDCFLLPDYRIDNERYLEAQVVLREICRVFLHEVERTVRMGSDIRTVKMFTQKKTINTFKQLKQRYIKERQGS